MSEYMERHTVSRLIGAPPGYVGFDQGGLLTEAIAKHPHCVLLLDEVEKAHPDVFNLLLQVMDHGTLTDNNGRKADFRHVVIVMTTNAGAFEMNRASIGFVQQDNASDGAEAIKRLFSPEFRNRIDAIIQFAPLDMPVIERVVDKLLMEIEAQLEKKGVSIMLDDAARSWLAEKGYDPKMGARPMARLMQEQIKRPLAEELLFGKLVAGGTVKIAVSVDGQNLKTRRAGAGNPGAAGTSIGLPPTTENAAEAAASVNDSRVVRSAAAVDDAALGQIVRRHLDGDLVAGEDADVVLAHFPGDMRSHNVPGLELHPERCVRQSLDDFAFHLNRIFFRHPQPVANEKAANSARKAWLASTFQGAGNRGTSGAAARLATRSLNSRRLIGRLPRVRRCGVGSWQSISSRPAAIPRSTSRASAVLEASRSRLNIDSPKNTRPSSTPYSPPTSSPSRRTSTLWACPRACNSQ